MWSGWSFGKGASRPWLPAAFPCAHLAMAMELRSYAAVFVWRARITSLKGKAASCRTLQESSLDLKCASNFVLSTCATTLLLRSPDSHVGAVKYGKLMLSERNVDARPDSFRRPQTLGGFILAAVVVMLCGRNLLWRRDLCCGSSNCRRRRSGCGCQIWSCCDSGLWLWCALVIDVLSLQPTGQRGELTESENLWTTRFRLSNSGMEES